MDSDRHGVEDARPAGDAEALGVAADGGRTVDDVVHETTARWRYTDVVLRAVDGVHGGAQLVHRSQPPLTCDDAVSSTIPQALRV